MEPGYNCSENNYSCFWGKKNAIRSTWKLWQGSGTLWTRAEFDTDYIIISDADYGNTHDLVNTSSTRSTH